MQYLDSDDPHGDRQEGLFVYQVLAPNGVQARNGPTVSNQARMLHGDGKNEGGNPQEEEELDWDPNDSLIFDQGDLIHVDCIVTPQAGSDDAHWGHGPYLRLADDSGGWLFARKFANPVLKRIEVEQGLWALYVDNYPIGVALRKQPIDRIEYEMTHQSKRVMYPPLQKLYCTAKVQHPVTGVCFYRVQGTNGWVFDKRIVTVEKQDVPVGLSDSVIMEEEVIQTMLRFEDSVQTGGLWAYKVLVSTCTILEGPRVPDENSWLGATTKKLFKDEVICCDVIAQDMVGGQGNGPFVRLCDGSGWLYENIQGKRILEPVAMSDGYWKVKVLAPQTLSRQPIDERLLSTKPRFSTRNSQSLLEGGHVVCDKQVAGSSKGVTFYRVIHSNGQWICDMRPPPDSSTVGMLPLLQLVQQGPPDAPPAQSWTVDYCRGMAAAVPGVRELVHNEECGILSFQVASSSLQIQEEESEVIWNPTTTTTSSSTSAVRINVYYLARTVGISHGHSRHGAKAQVFRRDLQANDLVELLQNPMQLTAGPSYYRRGPNVTDPGKSEKDGVAVHVEEEVRNDILHLENQVQELKQIQQTLYKALHSYDTQTAKEAIARLKQEAAIRNQVELPHLADAGNAPMPPGSVLLNSAHLQQQQHFYQEENTSTTTTTTKLLNIIPISSTTTTTTTTTKKATTTTSASSSGPLPAPMVVPAVVAAPPAAAQIADDEPAPAPAPAPSPRPAVAAAPAPVVKKKKKPQPAPLQEIPPVTSTTSTSSTTTTSTATTAEMTSSFSTTSKNLASSKSTNSNVHAKKSHQATTATSTTAAAEGGKPAMKKIPSKKAKKALAPNEQNAPEKKVKKKKPATESGDQQPSKPNLTRQVSEC